MTIYEDAKAYAKRNKITEEQAKIRCEHFLAVAKEVEAAKVCPKCNQPTLELEQGCYEGGYPDYIRCDNDDVLVTEEGETEPISDDCGFTSDITAKYELFVSGKDFDLIHYITVDMECQEEKTTADFPGDMSWSDFVDKDNASLLNDSLAQTK